MTWDAFGEHGLVGLIAGALLLGFGGIGVFAFWVTRFTLREIIKPAVERLVTGAVDVMRAHVEFLHTSTESLRKIETTVVRFEAESKDPNQPYSAVKCRRGQLLLGRLFTADPEDRRELLEELRKVVEA